MLSCEAPFGREAAWGKSPAKGNHLAHADEPLLHQDSQVSCGKSAARVEANLSEDRIHLSGKHLLAVLPKKRQEVREGPQDSSSTSGEPRLCERSLMVLCRGCLFTTGRR